MTNRYYVQTMGYYGEGTETWAVWDRTLRHEVTWVSHDRKAVTKIASAMNASAQQRGDDGLSAQAGLFADRDASPAVALQLARA